VIKVTTLFSYCGNPEPVREIREAVREFESMELTSTHVRTGSYPGEYKELFGFAGCVFL
jgi:hypothetical protein